MEVTCCSQSGTEPVHPPPGCELCKRTRLNSKYNSDCDSVVDKCRPYRSSTARSRYVNVCAAVCLLLLVGGLSPQSSAAPHRSRAMSRRSATENRLWANPCDYNEANTKSGSSKPSTEIAPKLVAQARSALTSMLEYKNTIASLHSFDKFDDLLYLWNSHEWLREFEWYREEILPKKKLLYSNMPDEYMNNLMKDIDEVLPGMYKGLKMIVAGLYEFSTKGFIDNIASDQTLKKKINQTMHDVRAVLCYFSDLMKARNLEIQPLLDNEVPDFTTKNKLSVGVLLYRDTLNYLEYLTQVFQKLYDTESA